MANALFEIPEIKNEPILSYEPESKEKAALKKQLKKTKSEQKDVPMFIGGQEIRTDETVDINPPHELDHVLGQYHKGNAKHVKMAIESALKAREKWANMRWEDRAAIFLKAADLLSGPYRQVMNAATMLGQSKTVHQSEIDAVAELCDFYRYNVKYMDEIYRNQPETSKNIWNRLEYRPLEGFVFALTPFNFTSIAGNLPAAPALMGNVVVWKPATSQILSAAVIMEILKEAGLPDGVINLIFVDGPTTGDVIFQHPEFAGLHFTGSTGVFRKLWGIISDNLENYNSYPRIVGETGGKDFIIAHESADTDELATAMTRGAYEFQGQKCSAVSRTYIPKSLWPNVQKKLLNDLNSIKMGSPEDFRNFFTAVIDEGAFEKITGYIDHAKDADGVEIIAGGNYSKEEGYFIEPTVILTSDPKYKSMKEEIFGPVLTIYVYDDDKYEETLRLVDDTSPYGLTGAIFAKDREAAARASHVLRQAAGNFYINDKPTGAVVGHQPFGGARASGTNDKAGSVMNLYRWVSVRSIKENMVPPKDYRYPFMQEA